MKRTHLVFVLALLLGAFTFSGCAQKTGGIAGGLNGDGDRVVGVQEQGIIFDSASGASLGADGSAEHIYDIFFNYDQYALTGEARDILENNAKILRRNSGSKVVVEGHCDDRGSNEYNIALGDRRAQSVKKYLSRIGISKKNISTVSYGEEKPFCDGVGKDCWQKNRRAHFVVKY